MTASPAIAPFELQLPRRILFGRGRAAEAAGIVAALGCRALLVRGRSAERARWLADALARAGVAVHEVACTGEPDLPALDAAVDEARGFHADCVVALGGGAAIDLGKALAALAPGGDPLDHLEVVGRGLPLAHAPLPFVALPTTAGTGAEVTRNAVIGVPEHRRKVSLRDPRMLPAAAIVDPALTDGCPWAVTLASGLDALTQVIEPYVSSRANPVTDALCRPAIPAALAALRRLEAGEDAAARDDLAFASLTGGLALANAGLGAVHGLAGVIGGLAPAPHGAVCGVLLPHVLEANAAVATGTAASRLSEVRAALGGVLGVPADAAPAALAAWAEAAGLPRLAALGLDPADHAAAAEAALASSSMKGNPVPLPVATLAAILAAA